MHGVFELVPVRIKEAANEPWLAFPQRHEVSVTRNGEYTRVVLTKPAEETPALPQPVWA
jgi:hypothetical protein